MIIMIYFQNEHRIYPYMQLWYAIMALHPAKLNKIIKYF